MDGFRFTIKGHLLKDCVTKQDVYVWSNRRKPFGVVDLVLLPEWMAEKFRANPRLHTVITNLDGNYLEENNLVR